MISWATTIAPETQFSSVGGISNTQPLGPGLASTIIITQEAGTTYYFDWSRTYSSTSFAVTGEESGGVTSDSTVSVLGLVDATNGNSFTRRSVLDVTTATTTTNYTYLKTETSQSSTTIASTTLADEETITTQVETDATVVTATSIASAPETVTVLTTGEETIATPLLATIWRAGKSEVLYAALTKSATAASNFSYALDEATSAEQTTVLPYSATAAAVQKQTNETSEFTLPLVSVAFGYSRESQTNTETTTVTNYEVLPQSSQTTQIATTVLSQTNTSFTVLPEQIITAAATASAASMVVSAGPTQITRRGQSFLTSTTFRSTTTRLYALPTAETGASVDADSLATRSSQTIVAITTYDVAPRQSIATTIGGISESRNFYSGVVDDDGGLAAGYSCQEIGTVDITAFVERNVRSLFPTTAEYFNGFSVAGSLSVSKNSITAQNAAGTSTSSFAVSAFGEPMFSYATRASGSKIDGALLGQSETLFQTLLPGVYSSTQTFSTAGGGLAFSTPEQSRLALVPVLALGPATDGATANVVTWTAARNSHPSFTRLTGATAYSA